MLAVIRATTLKKDATNNSPFSISLTITYLVSRLLQPAEETRLGCPWLLASGFWNYRPLSLNFCLYESRQESTGKLTADLSPSPDSSPIISCRNVL